MEKVIKVLVLGSTGMLGHQVFSELNKDGAFEIHDLVYRSKLRPESIVCDVTNRIEVQKVISGIAPDVIINCIGVLIKGSSSNPANAIYINAYFPNFLVEIASKIGAKVIHVSTDCVFSGVKGMYSESDFKDANDVYGRSKSLGEINLENHLTIRTSIVGPELKSNGEGLLHWFLGQKNEVNGFSKAFWGGVSTLECARAIVYSIKENINGLVNLTNGSAISKFDMLGLFAMNLNWSDMQINRVEGKFVDKSLKSEREDFEYSVPSYEIMFEDMINQMKENIEQYPHYTI